MKKVLLLKKTVVPLSLSLRKTEVKVSPLLFTRRHLPIFLFIVYRGFGVIAGISLMVNLGMIIGLTALFGATLTLPGIAGIVLTLGMAVDANVLPFERVRDEVRSGVPTLRAVNLGFDRAMKTVLDGNLTTLICALVLFQFGAGPIRGFAVTLSIGIMTT